MTVQAAQGGAAGTAARAAAASPSGRAAQAAACGIPARFSPVPAPGTPPGTFTPGVPAVGAERDGDRIIRITRLAHAVPGKPDGEVDTRPLRPIWQLQQPWDSVAGSRGEVSPGR
jgi:hypothetical protein